MENKLEMINISVPTPVIVSGIIEGVRPINEQQPSDNNVRYANSLSINNVVGINYLPTQANDMVLVKVKRVVETNIFLTQKQAEVLAKLVNRAIPGDQSEIQVPYLSREEDYATIVREVYRNHPQARNLTRFDSPCGE